MALTSEPVATSSRKVRIAGALFLLSGLLNLGQVIGVEAGGGWPDPRDLLAPVGRVAVCATLAWGLLRGWRWAWWGSLVVGGLWWLLDGLTMAAGVAMTMMTLPLSPQDILPIAPLIGTFLALSVVLVLLLSGVGYVHPGSSAPAGERQSKLPMQPSDGGETASGRIAWALKAIGVLLVLIAVWRYSNSIQANGERLGLRELYDTLTLVLPAKRIGINVRGTELSVKVDWLPSDSPSGSRLQTARGIGRVVRDRYKGSAGLSLVTVVFQGLDSTGSTTGFVAPFRMEQLQPGDTSPVMSFTSRIGP